MKIKNLNQSNYNKIQVNLLNLKFYLKPTVVSKITNINQLKSLLNFVEINLKTILKIIFEYHQLNRFIIFVGFPDIGSLKFSLLFKRLKYNHIQNKIWIDGFLCNPNLINRYLTSKRTEYFFKKENLYFFKNFINFSSKKKIPDLIIVFNQKDNKNVIKEAYKLKIPVITFMGDNSNGSVSIGNILQFNSFYISKLLSKFFYFILSAVLTRQLKKNKKK